jgi:hypothetical protein
MLSRVAPKSIRLGIPLLIVLGIALFGTQAWRAAAELAPQNVNAQVMVDFQTVVRELARPPLPGLNMPLGVSGVAVSGGGNPALFSADSFASLPAFAAVSEPGTRPRVRVVFSLERLGYDYDPIQPIINRVNFGEGLAPILVDFAPAGYTESYDARGGVDDFLETLARLGLDVYFTIDSIPRQPKTVCDAQVTASVDPKGTYLHTSGDTPGAPAIVDLAAHGFLPGNPLKLTYTGNFKSWLEFVGPRDVLLLGVFSSSATLLAPEEAQRVPGAMEAGADYITSPTYFGPEPTDIPEDFRLYPPYRTPEEPTGFVITIPAGATHLFLGVSDSFLADNAGELFVTLESPAAPSHCLASIPQAIAGVPAAMKWNTSPPRDYAEWANLMEQLVAGHPAIKSWAIWNEPNLTLDPPWFWRGSQAEFFELYDRTAAGLARQAGSGVEIGGYGDPFVVNPWVQAFLAAPRARLDFLSYHRYSCDPAALTQAYNQMRQWQAAAGASQVPLVLEEFGLGTGPNPPCPGRTLGDEAGSNFQGAFVAAALIDLYGAGLRDAYYWDDDTWDTNQNDLVRFDREILPTCGTPGACPVNEFRSFTLRELTPLQQVFQVFGRLFQTVVSATSDEPDVHVLATKSGDGKQVALVLANFAATAKSASVTVAHLPAGVYQVSEYLVADQTISLGDGVVFDGNAALWEDKVARVRALGRIQPARQHQSEPIVGALAATVDLAPYAVALLILEPTDSTPPIITPTITGTAGRNGWYVSDVSVSWGVVDSESPISSQSGCGPSVITADITGMTLTCTATSAGGSATQSVEIKRDATAPIVHVTGVISSAAYTLGSVPTAGCTTQDALSGVATPATVTVTGGNAQGLGQFIAICSGASDWAGNTGAASATYRVGYPFTGFFPPVENPPVVNSVKAGQAIPIKFSLAGNRGLDIFAQGYPASQQVVCHSGAPVSELVATGSAGNSSLHYDPTSGQYTYTWKSEKAWAGQCRKSVIRLKDGTDHVANFVFK